jgi:hypothetical protein
MQIFLIISRKNTANFDSLLHLVRKEFIWHDLAQNKSVPLQPKSKSGLYHTAK